MKRVASGILPLVTIDRTLSAPLHRQIYDGFRSAILEGRLRPGQRIPSTRVLAAEIRVSRFPVLNAYAQLLAEGYLESRVGAGTLVSSSLPEQMTSSRLTGTKTTPIGHGPRRVAARTSLFPPKEALPWMIHRGPFRVGQVAFDQFPHQIWSSLVARRCRSMDAHSAHYGVLMGSEPLRHAIANYLKTARSVRCAPEHVLIVNGSQQALEITARVLLDPGARVWIEEPCYRLAHDVFKLNGCQLVPVAVDDEGLDVAAAITKCRNARAAFVSPSHQFPLGVTMSASRRFQLIEWAQNSGAWIIEDDYDSEYRYESQPIASLQGLDPNSRVIYIGTFSKVLFPSLRLGYIVAPPDLVDRFLVVRRVMDLGAPTFHQEVLADFIEEGHFERHIRRMRTLYGDLRRLLVDNLREHLGKTLSPIGDEAGMHLTVMLHTKHRDEEVAARAVRQKLSLWPLSRLYLSRPRQGFILGFGGTTATEIPLAVRRLRTLLDSWK
jgi:GntR family transcriptional regulator / MocR family aminotransferase